MKQIILLLTVLLSFQTTAQDQKYINHSKVLNGVYKGTNRNGPLEVKSIPTSSPDYELLKDDCFEVLFDDGTIQRMCTNNAGFGEWYKAGRAPFYLRFILESNGKVILEMGNDQDYDQIVDPYREYTFTKNVEADQLDLFEGLNNKEAVAAKKKQQEELRKCREGEQYLKEEYINTQASKRYVNNDKTLHLILEQKGDHYEAEGILEVEKEEQATPKITHKVKIWWDEKNDTYKSTLQNLDCGKLIGDEEHNDADIDGYLKFVVIDGNKYERSRGY